MAVVSDILKLLETWPAWARLKAAPDRVDALEKRVAALEAALAQRPARDACPKCGGALAIDGDKPHPMFGVMGVRVRSLRCAACGFATEKELKPGEV